MLALSNDSTRNRNLPLPFLRRSWNQERQERQWKIQRLTQTDKDPNTERETETEGETDRETRQDGKGVRGREIV